MLLMGKLDIEADSAAAIFKGAMMGRLHNAGATAGDDGMTIPSEQTAQLAGLDRVFVIWLDPRRAINHYALRVSPKSLEAMKEVVRIVHRPFDIGGG